MTRLVKIRSKYIRGSVGVADRDDNDISLPRFDTLNILSDPSKIEIDCSPKIIYPLWVLVFLLKNYFQASLTLSKSRIEF